MASTLGPDDVDRIATLARLTLTNDERERFGRQLNDVLQMVEQVRQVDTTGISATSHPLPVETSWREDVARPSLPIEDVLVNAPDANRDAGLFRVPKVIGQVTK